MAKGRGAKPSLPEGTVAEVVRVTLNENPADTSTHWTTRSLARRVGVGKDTVAKIWRDHNLKPWKVDTEVTAALRRLATEGSGGTILDQPISPVIITKIANVLFSAKVIAILAAYLALLVFVLH